MKCFLEFFSSSENRLTSENPYTPASVLLANLNSTE